MKIFDCFLYNGEKDIVSLRFEIMGPYVDFFVILEANQTFSGISKDVFFEKHKHAWEKWESKILFFPVTNLPDGDAWKKEHFLRNQLKEKALAQDKDIIIIADADEIINLKNIDAHSITEPTIIQLPTFYHFANIKSSEIFNLTLISPFHFIKNKDIGNRNIYQDFIKKTIAVSENFTGAHLTYQFGNNIDKYITKIQSFSHQEFNTPYWLNTKRLESCIKFDIDLFERRQFRYKHINLEKLFPDLFYAIKKLNLTYLYKPKGLANLKLKFLRFLNYYYMSQQYKRFRLKISYFKKKILS